MSEQSVAHVIEAAFRDAGYQTIITGYDPERLTMVVEDDKGRIFDVTAEISRMRPVGAVILGLVSEGVES